MKKKLITLTVVFALLLSVFPVNIFAKETQSSEKYNLEERAYKNKVYIEIKKPTKSQIKAVGSALEYYRQIFLETIDDYYPDFDPNATYEGFMKECYESYLDVVDYINSATDVEDLVLENMFFWIIVSDDFYEKLNVASEFSKMLENYNESITDSENFNNFKNISIKQQKNIFDCLSYDSFSEYYKTIINGRKITTAKNLKSTENYTQLASAKADLVKFVVENVDEGFDLNYSEIDEDECYFYPYYEENIYYSDEAFERVDVYPILKYYYYDKGVYNKEEANVIKKTYTRYLYVYVQRQLKKEGLYNEEVASIYNSAITKIKKSITVDEAVEYSLQAIEEIEELTGSTYKDISAQKLSNLSQEIYTLYDKYTEDLYSEDNYMTIYETINNVEMFIDNCIKDAELPSNLIGNLDTFLDKIPTKAEELKLAKQKYIKYLNKFKNNVKYNQTKVVPIVNEGVKLINNATTIEKVKSIYIKYYNKAKATIKKFNIKTSKSGNGYITSSKVAKYGSSVSISIKPKTGYKISKLYVDGKRVKITTKYTFKNITKSHTIKAVFVKK